MEQGTIELPVGTDKEYTIVRIHVLNPDFKLVHGHVV
jgi:hypothetical protein